MADNFSSLFEFLPIGAYRSSLDGRQLRANRALVKLNGYEDEATMLAEVNDIERQWYVDPGRRADFREQLSRHGQVHDFISEVYRYKTRERIWIREHAFLVRDADGAPLHYEGTVEDITALKRGEDAQHIVLEQLSQGVAVFDADGMLVYANKSAQELAGIGDTDVQQRLSLREIVTRQFANGEFDEPYASTDVRALVRRWLDSSVPFKLHNYSRKTRQGRALEVRSNRLPNGGMVRLYIDVTDHVTAQDALRAREELLRDVIENIEQGVLVVDPGGELRTFNQRFLDLLALPRELMLTAKHANDIIEYQIKHGHLDGAVEIEGEPSGAKTVAQEVLNGERDQLPTNYLRGTFDGRVLRLKTCYLSDGSRLRTCLDLTDIHRANDALASKTRLLEAALAHMSQGMLMVDATGAVQVANRRYGELLGLPPAYFETPRVAREVWEFQLERGDFADDTETSVLVGQGMLGDDGGLVPITRPSFLRNAFNGQILEVSTHPLADGGMVRTLTNVTAYEEARRDLSYRSAQLQLTLDSIEQGLVLYDGTGRIETYNRRLLELLDIPGEAMAGFRTVSDMIGWQRAHRHFASGIEGRSSEEVERMLDAMAGEQVPSLGSAYRRRTPQGLILHVQTREVPGGRVVRTFLDVTETYRANEALAEKSRILDAALQSMDQGMAMSDADGNLLVSNRRLKELLALPESLMASRPSTRDIWEFQMRRGDFAHDPNLAALAAQGSPDGQGRVLPIHSQTFRRRSPNGRVLEVKVSVPDGGGVIRTVTDITGFVRAERALEQKEAQLRTVIRHVPFPIWLKQRNGVFQVYNEAYATMFGVEAGRFGLLGTQMYDEEEVAIQRHTDHAAMSAHEPLVFERTFTVPGGDRRTVEITKVALRDTNGRCTAIIGTARDVTATREHEAFLIAARESAEAGTRAKAEFLANMSHELRTPMNAVIGMTELLLGSSLDTAQREYAQTIRASGDALLALINDILTLSKIEAGKVELEREPLSLRDCIESAIDIAAGSARGKGLEMLYWLDDDVPDVVLGDLTRLRQIFLNLLSNAIKFTSSGEVRVHVQRARRADGLERLHVRVEDTGVGIPPDRQDRLFGLFSQVDASITRLYGGTGLGLAICKRLVTLMDGRIWVESVFGQGSCFQFEIPYEMPVDVLAGPAASPPSRPRVLAVSDNPRLLRMLQDLRRDEFGCDISSRTPGSAGDWSADLAGCEALILDCRIRDAALKTILAARPAGLATIWLSAGEPPPGPGFLVHHKPPRLRLLAQAVRGEPQRSREPTRQAAPRLAPVRDADLPARVLLAEDNLINQRVAQLILASLGYRDVPTAGNGRLALDAIVRASREGQPFDVVLMDVQMPELDGLEATRALCELQDAGTRPWIIALTANAMEGDRDMCLEAGMDDYLTKPIRTADLAACLRMAAQALGKRRGYPA